MKGLGSYVYFQMWIKVLNLRLNRALNFDSENPILTTLTGASH